MYRLFNIQLFQKTQNIVVFISQHSVSFHSQPINLVDTKSRHYFKYSSSDELILDCEHIVTFLNVESRSSVASTNGISLNTTIRGSAKHPKPVSNFSNMGKSTFYIYSNPTYQIHSTPPIITSHKHSVSHPNRF